MKVAIVIFAVAIVGALAQEDSTIPPPPPCTSNAFVCKMKELGHYIKEHAKRLGGKLAEVGKSVLSAGIEQGKNLLVNGGQAVLGTVLEHMNKSGIIGKRHVIMEKLGEHVKNGVEHLKKVHEFLKGAFTKAVAKITDVMKKNAALKVDDDTDKKVDGAVDDFKKDSKSGFAKIAAGIKEKLSNMFAKGMDMLKEKFSKKTEKRAILDTIKNVWGKAKEHFTNIVGGLANTFQPHLDALTEGVKGLASKAKEHATNLVEAAKGHFNALKDKLSGHLDTLKGHGAKLGEHAKNALNALKEAVASIASQAAGHLKDTVGDMLNTGKDAAKVVKDHVTGN